MSRDADSKVDRAELEHAFALFTEASRQLVESYQELEARVASLTEELAVANGALRQQFEEKAALSHRLESLLDALPGGVVELDADGRISTLNPAAVRVLGDAMQGQDWQTAVLPLLSPTAVAGEWIIHAGTSAEKRLSLVETRRPSGERILLLHDVDESWRLRMQLEHHKRLAAMGEMAAGLAHQLRTPLSTALLYVSNLARADLVESERSRFGERALARLRHLESLIQNMLQFVRGQQAAVEPVALQDVVDEALQTVLPHRMGRKLVNTGGPSGARVTANRKELLGALINLLENAIHATADTGHIEIGWADDPAGCAIVVRDDGCGMSEIVRERLFEPFFTTRKEGTGLGLAIVANLVATWHGSITVESTPGAGSCFKIVLPAAA